MSNSWRALAILIPAAFMAGGLFAASPTDTPRVVFSKDVAPVLQRHCQTCHRPGEAAPFSLLTYEQARPWAKAIKEAVLLKKMPPWFADPHYGRFSNDRSLSQSDVNTLVAWADGGAPEGDARDLPPKLAYLEGWSIPKPDVVFEFPRAFQIPATGTIEYQKVIVPSGFTEDKWVQFAEARPDDRAHVHHMILYVREPASHWLRGEKAGVFFVAPKATDASTDTSALPSDFLVGYAPGQPPEILPPGQGKLVKAGSDFVMEIHYTTNGTAGADRSKFGLVFAKERPKERVLTLSATNGKFKIPPGDPDYRVDAAFEVGAAVKLASLHPHMHGRGKDFEYRIVYPTGGTQTILRVPRYNWHWQLWYNLAEPLVLPKGARIECTAHFDNSPNNPDNLDPSKEVTWGDQSWDEMMVGFFNLEFPADMPVEDILQRTVAKKRLLAIGEEKGYRHEAVSHALATIERLGRENGLWDTTIRTDTEALTKKKLEYNAPNLNDFDAVLFYTGGTLEMDDRQKADFLSFIHDDGKGFIGVHSATITFTNWPEYGEMIGGYYDEHPWGTFNAPIVVEDPAFPGMRQWPGSFVLRDEVYQLRNYSRDKLRVLLRLDADKLDLANKNVHRTDRDFAVAWAKMYGQGRVFYSTLGHPVENWDRNDFQKMYFEAIKWAMKLQDADVMPRPLGRQP
jgi:type 1 glutamine amidotransferase